MAFLARRHFAAVLAFAVGCGPSAIAPLKLSPETMATDALAEYDANKDGKLDATELKKCPALADSLASIDTSGDKSLDAAELTARFTTYKTGGVSLRDVMPRVQRGGKGVAGITITLEPEKFMGSGAKPATGVTGPNGDATLKTEGQSLPAVELGCYRLIVSHKDPGGKELLPAKFNAATIFGVEVAPSNRINLIIDLDR